MAGVAFVTGATGFVGGAVLRRLLTQGWSITALARSPQAAESLERAGVRVARGDVLDPASLETAMRGSDVVFHVAGVVAPCARDPATMLRTNVIGTANVIDTAARAGVRRVVHTSSTAAIGEPAGTTAREDTPHRGWFLSDYERSKFEAEVLAFTRGRGLGLEVVAVSPSSVQGPGRADGTGRLLLAAARGRARVAIDTTISLVDVDDCAAGHVLAAERGGPGERYILSGATLTVRRALRIVGDAAGHPVRTVLLPPSSVLAVGSVVETLARLARRDPPICRATAATLLHGRSFDGSRAERDLGLAYTPVERTIARTIAWFEAEGLLARDRRAGRHRG